MKHFLLIACGALILSACSKEEPAQPVEIVTDEVQVGEDVSEVTDAADTVAGEETLEVVEESAAEPDANEQAILLAQADLPPAQDWQFEQGKHFIRLVPTQMTLGGADKIEVAEFFWYGCQHCYSFETAINRWAAEIPANARFVRIPAMWNNLLVLHARLYYTEQILVRSGHIKEPAVFRNAVFQEYHQRGNRLTSEAAIQKLFEGDGVSAEEFTRTWNSFEVDQKLRVAGDLARRYSISSVPTMVVNGKYRTGAAEAGGYPVLLDVLDELVARESAR
jgi:thiol:disulfide interchange protein DsbA